MKIVGATGLGGLCA